MSDLIDRQAAINALENDKATLDHIIRGMSANDVRLDAYVSQRNQVNYDIDTINNLPTAQLGTDLAEVGTEERAEERTETHACDCINRQQAIDEIDEWIKAFRENGHKESAADACLIHDGIIQLPSAQSESCEYYALCRHGRDENKLRARLGFCEYCNEDVNGFVTPLEKNGHAFVRFGMNGWELSLKANGWHGSAKIKYCPICGRRLTDG